MTGVQTCALPIYPTLVQIFSRSPNGVEDEDHSNDTLNIPLISPIMWDTDKIYVEVNTGQMSAHIYWDIKDENGTIIKKGGNDYVAIHETQVNTGAGQYYPNTLAFDTIDLSAYPNQCLTLKVISGYGCGIDCTDEPTGHYIRFMKGTEVIYDFSQFGWKKFGKVYTTFQNAPLEVSYAVQNETESQDNGAITATAIGGVSPYDYSVDCGASLSWLSVSFWTA